MLKWCSPEYILQVPNIYFKCYFEIDCKILRVFNGFIPNIQMGTRGCGFQAFHLLVISSESQILQECNFSWCHRPWDGEKIPVKPLKRFLSWRWARALA